MRSDIKQLVDKYHDMHQNPFNRWLHILGLLLAWSAFIYGFVHPVYWIGIPLSYLLAVLGHYLFEKNVPAFTLYIRDHGWNWKGILLMVCIEELSIMRIAWEEVEKLTKNKST